MGWGFTSTKKQAFKILEKVDNSSAQVPESQQQKAELRVLANSQCGFWSGALTGGLRSSQMCAGDSTAQVCILFTALLGPSGAQGVTMSVRRKFV